MNRRICPGCPSELCFSWTTLEWFCTDCGYKEGTEMDKMQDLFFGAVVDEYIKASNKHLLWPHKDITFAVSILNEEAGKLTRIANDVKAGRLTMDKAAPDLQRYAARVGAMALRFTKGLASGR